MYCFRGESLKRHFLKLAKSFFILELKFYDPYRITTHISTTNSISVQQIKCVPVLYVVSLICWSSENNAVIAVATEHSLVAPSFSREVNLFHSRSQHVVRARAINRIFRTTGIWFSDRFSPDAEAYIYIYIYIYIYTFLVDRLL